jgi:hypothetical protein
VLQLEARAAELGDERHRARRQILEHAVAGRQLLRVETPGRAFDAHGHQHDLLPPVAHGHVHRAALRQAELDRRAVALAPEARAFLRRMPLQARDQADRQVRVDVR